MKVFTNLNLFLNLTYFPHGLSFPCKKPIMDVTYFGRNLVSPRASMSDLPEKYNRSVSTDKYEKSSMVTRVESKKILFDKHTFWFAKL